MGLKTGFIRTLLMGAVVVMMGCASTVAPHRHQRPQTRMSVEVRFHGEQYFTPWRYQAYRPYMRGPVNRSRVTPRPSPQRRRSMMQRPDRQDRQERPNVRPNRQDRPDARPDRDRTRRTRPQGVSMLNEFRERVSAWAISRRTVRPAVLEMPELPVMEVFEFADYYIDFDYLPEPPPLPAPGESYGN